jgi:phage host-nuclease inhibitor protein Gam
MPKIKKAINPIPSRDEMETLVADIRHLQIGVLRLTADREAYIKAIDDRIGPKLADRQSLIDEKTVLVQSWAESNPDEFAKRKSIELTHGTIGFRTGTPKLVLLSRAWNWAKALVAVQKHLPNFIRSAPEIDKEAIIAQRDELAEFLPTCGVKVAQGETFFLEPKIDDITTAIKKEAA